MLSIFNIQGHISVQFNGCGTVGVVGGQLNPLLKTRSEGHIGTRPLEAAFQKAGETPFSDSGACTPSSQ
jgi:hypothetical protein